MLSDIKKKLLEFYNYERTIKPFDRIPEGYSIYDDRRRPITDQYWAYGHQSDAVLNLFLTPSFLKLLVNDEFLQFEKLLIFTEPDPFGRHDRDERLVITDSLSRVDHDVEPTLQYDIDKTTVRELQSPAGQEYINNITTRYVMITISEEG